MPPELQMSTMSTDIILKGNLRKAKNWNKRFFVLRDGSPAKLDYYDNERKWKNGSSKPKRRISLEKPWNIDKKKDSKHDHLIVIFTENDYFSMAAENADVQDMWISALQRVAKPEPGSVLFKHMWHVVLDNKELEDCKSTLAMGLHGPHRVCLTHDQMVFVHANTSGGGDRSKGEPVEIQMTSIRVCGHKEGMFFIEPGRSSGIGCGRLWMDLNDEAMAANMHQTIIKVMYTLKPEEANGYRGRCNSSGSSSGRFRSVRSHHNNPPPSQVGMGKMANASSSSNKQRFRCDSLPGSRVGGLNDSRLRTGSEGENTMKRPSRFRSLRITNGSSSPTSMRNRLWFSHNRRGTTCHHHHSVSFHPRTTSLPGSCNGSSTASSTEQLNGSVVGGDLASTNGMTSHLPPPTSSQAVSDNTANDDYFNNHSPTLQRQNGSISRPYKQYHSNGRCTTPDNQHLFGGPLAFYDSVDHSNHYCSTCLGPMSYAQFRSDGRLSFSMAPPPPDMDPPHNPLNTHEYANIPAIQSRTHSIDGSLSCETAASSLSGSPPHPSDLDPDFPSKQTGITQEDANSPPQTPTSSTPKSQTPPTSSAESPASTDDYTEMGVASNGSYPHHKMPAASDPKVSSSSHSSIISKLFTGSSSSSQNKTSASAEDYTPMNPGQSSSFESKMLPKTLSDDSNGYVPMKPIVAKSLPQDIGSRRRSVPDMAFRGYGHNRSSPPYGYSPEKYSELLNPMPCCQECMFVRRTSIAEESSDYKVPSLYRTSCENCLFSGTRSPDFDKESTTVVTTTGYLAPAIGESLPVSSPNQNRKSETEEYMKMQPLNQAIQDIAKPSVDSSKGDTNDVSVSSVSSSPAEASVCLNEMEGYLPMSPWNVGLSTQRCTKNVVNSILSLTENDCTTPTPPPQYPHQRKERNTGTVTTSLERPKNSRRCKRPKSLPFRHNSSNNSRRTLSLKHGKKNLNDSSPESQVSPPLKTAAPSRPPLSPGGEYVNIDFSKAQEQLRSPYVLSVVRS